jgi:hypothetical protein
LKEYAGEGDEGFGDLRCSAEECFGLWMDLKHERSLKLVENALGEIGDGESWKIASGNGRKKFFGRRKARRMKIGKIDFSRKVHVKKWSFLVENWILSWCLKTSKALEFSVFSLILKFMKTICAFKAFEFLVIENKSSMNFESTEDFKTVRNSQKLPMLS